jgi:hypothetical protein
LIFFFSLSLLFINFYTYRKNILLGNKEKKKEKRERRERKEGKERKEIVLE